MILFKLEKLCGIRLKACSTVEQAFSLPVAQGG